MPSKAHLCTIRMSDEEQARANALAEHYSLSVSALVRMLIKRDADGLGVSPPSPKRAKK